MNNNNYQYNSCTSKGICSINPRTSALQNVLILYLRHTAYYALKLFDNNIVDEQAENIILNTISIMVSNVEFAEVDFIALVSGFNKVLPSLISKYQQLCKKIDIQPNLLKENFPQNADIDIIKFIQFGEKEYLTTTNLNSEIRDLYKLAFVIAKSICINILDLETYDLKINDETPKMKDGYYSILVLLNMLNKEFQDAEVIKELMQKFVKVDNVLMQMLYQEKESRYGKPNIAEVSYSTRPSKAVLVVGSNIRELEDVLEALENEEIDVYTHDEMILANMYPKFREYKALRGQYGQGIENCILDFSTFPGPIILTRHSLYNVENLYRGLLYTTDFASSKGVIKIKHKNFTELINSAKSSRGFHTGKQCETVSIGFDFDNFIRQIDVSIDKYSSIVVIGAEEYTYEQKAYFRKLLTQIPKNVLIISLSDCKQQDNVISMNGCFDAYAITRISEYLVHNYSKPVVLFFPKCGWHSISQMIYIRKYLKIKIFVGNCSPIMLNPNMIMTLQKSFGIKSITSVKKDLEDIL